MVQTLRLTRSPNYHKKFRVSSPNGWHVDFGASGYSDYTIHKDPKRKDRYLTRHRKHENWGASGIKTAGFWSRWLLWEKPSLNGARAFIEKKFKVIVR